MGSIYGLQSFYHESFMATASQLLASRMGGQSTSCRSFKADVSSASTSLANLLSTQLIIPNFPCYALPPTQHHSFLRNSSPLLTSCEVSQQFIGTPSPSWVCLVHLLKSMTSHRTGAKSFQCVVHFVDFNVTWIY